MSSVIINPYYVYPSSLLLLDEAGLGSAAAAYSVRKLRSAYSDACMRIRRSSDSIEGDFGFVNNVLSSSSVISNISTRVTAFGNAQIDTAQSKFGGASGLFNAVSGDKISVANSAALNPGTGDFTCEFWVRWNSTPNRDCFLSWNGSHGLFITPSTGAILIWKKDGGTILSAGSTAFSTGVWYHIAFVRNGTSWVVYRDGISYVSTTSSASIGTSTGSLVISDFVGTDDWIDGWIDDYRFTVGVARYTSNFTPPASAHPIGNSDPYWANVVLLLPMDGSDGSTTFTDQSLTDKTLSQFCSGTDGFVAKWYDQSGNARNLVQATASNQPKIVSSGTVLTGANGKPLLRGDGSNDSLSSASSFSWPSARCTLLLVYMTSWTSADTIHSSRDNLNRLRLYQSTSSPNLSMVDNSVGTVSVNLANEATASWLSIFCLWNSNGNTSTAAINGNANATGTASVNTPGNGLILFNSAAGTQAAEVDMHEFVGWPTDVSAAAATAKANQNAYFSIY